MRIASSNTSSKQVLIVGSLFGITGVAFGALGAHAFRGQLTADQMGAFQTAVNYQLLHALLLVALAAHMNQDTGKLLRWAGITAAVGVICFSGSIYALVLLGWRWLGPITPLGGILMMAGWALVGLHAMQKKE